MIEIKNKYKTYSYLPDLISLSIKIYHKPHYTSEAKFSTLVWKHDD